MTPTRKLLQHSAAIFWSHPSTWIPAVASGAISYTFAFGCSQLRRPMIYALSPKSVLGGVTVQMNTQVLFVGFLLQWLPMLLEVTAFVYGLGVTSQLVANLVQYPQHNWKWGIPHGFRKTLIRTVFAGLAVLGLSIYFLTASQNLRSQAHSKELAAALFLIVGSPVRWLIVPTWQRYCERNQPGPEQERLRLPAYTGFLLGAAGSLAADVLLSRVIGQVFSDFHASSLSLSFTLNLVAACVSQLGIAFGFIALALPSVPQNVDAMQLNTPLQSS